MGKRSGKYLGIYHYLRNCQNEMHSKSGGEPNSPSVCFSSGSSITEACEFEIYAKRVATTFFAFRKALKHKLLIEFESNVDSVGGVGSFDLHVA